MMTLRNQRLKSDPDIAVALIAMMKVGHSLPLSPRNQTTAGCIR
jgi:hypothetical protein